MSPGFFVWHTMSEVMGALPPSLAEKIARGLGAGTYYVWRNKRRVTRENFARVLNKPANHPQVGRVARTSFSNYTVYILNMLRYDRVTLDEFRSQVHFDIDPKTHALLLQDRPVIFVSAHFGNMDYAAPAAVARYRPITMAAETINPPELFDHLARLRSAHGIHLIPYDRAPRKIIEALKRKEIVGFMLDFGINSHKDINTTPVTFFGEKTTFPASAVILAQRYQAPMVVSFAQIGPNDEIHIRTSPPIFVPRDQPREQVERDTMQRIAEDFERIIRAYPDQWYIFRPIWPAKSNTQVSNHPAGSTRMNLNSP